MLAFCDCCFVEVYFRMMQTDDVMPWQMMVVLLLLLVALLHLHLVVVERVVACQKQILGPIFQTDDWTILCLYWLLP